MESVETTKLIIQKFSENANVEINNKLSVVPMEEPTWILATWIVWEEEKPFTGVNANTSILSNVDVEKEKHQSVVTIWRPTEINVLHLVWEHKKNTKEGVETLEQWTTAVKQIYSNRSMMSSLSNSETNEFTFI